MGWATSFQSVCDRFSPGASVKITWGSTLILEGDITLENLALDGALVIKAAPGCHINIKRLNVVNRGWLLEPIPEDCQDEIAKIRGFTINRFEARELIFDEPGDHTILEP